MRDSPSDPFAEFVAMARPSAPRHLLRALLDTTDTAFACKLWFESQGINPQAADIVSMASLVLEREAELRARDEAVHQPAPRPTSHPVAPSPRSPTPADPWGG